jgi:hypothetical protein
MLSHFAGRAARRQRIPRTPSVLKVKLPDEKKGVGEILLRNRVNLL